MINASWSPWKPIGNWFSMRTCYLGHLRTQVDLSQVDGLRQQVVEQLAEQHAISEGLGQVTDLNPTRTKLDGGAEGGGSEVCRCVRD